MTPKIKYTHWYISITHTHTHTHTHTCIYIPYILYVHIYTRTTVFITLLCIRVHTYNRISLKLYMYCRAPSKMAAWSWSCRVISKHTLLTGTLRFFSVHSPTLQPQQFLCVCVCVWVSQCVCVCVCVCVHNLISFNQNSWVRVCIQMCLLSSIRRYLHIYMLCVCVCYMRTHSAEHTQNITQLWILWGSVSGAKCWTKACYSSN